MLDIAIKKLLHSLRGRNARIVQELEKKHEEMQIDIVLDMLEEYGVKIAFTVTNRFNDNVFVSNLEHACHRFHDENAYNAIHLDFSTPFKRNRKNCMRGENDKIIATMSELGFTWNGNVAVCDKLTF